MKMLVAIMLAVILLVAFGTPVFADQPFNPGFAGELISEGAQTGEGSGVSPEIHQAQEDARAANTNLGQSFKLFLRTYCGIPPKHTP